MSPRRKPESDTTKHDRAIAALLSCSTLAEAAREAGVPYSSFRRLIQQEDFKVELREAKRAVLDGALVYLSGLAQKAVQVIEAALDNQPVSATRLRAAQWSIDKAMEGRDQDFEDRLAEVERRLGYGR